jgi:hypothetical protein
MYENVEQEDIRNSICDRYTAAEIVDLLDLTSEEIFDILVHKIIKNIAQFDLIERDFRDVYAIEEYEEEEEIY